MTVTLILIIQCAPQASKTKCDDKSVATAATATALPDIKNAKNQPEFIIYLTVFCCFFRPLYGLQARN